MHIRRAFTLIELLVVISIIALLIAILLPALSSARTSAQRAQSNTQIRGIHQGFFTSSQDNKGWYPGISSKGVNASSAAATFLDHSQIGPDKIQNGSNPTILGASVFARWFILMDGDFVTPDYLISPKEIAEDIAPATPEAYTGSNKLAPNTPINSYSLPMLVFPVNFTDPPALGRCSEWRDTVNATVPIVSDRLLDTPGRVASDTSTHQSLWSTPDKPGAWSGAIAFNDGHVDIKNDSFFEAGEITYRNATSTGRDNLFHENDQSMGTFNPGPLRRGHSAAMVARAFNQYWLTPGP